MLSAKEVGAAVGYLNAAKDEQKRRSEEENRVFIRKQLVTLDRETRGYLGNVRKWNEGVEHRRNLRQSLWTPGKARTYSSSAAVKQQGIAELRFVQATYVLESKRKEVAWREFREERAVDMMDRNSPRRVTLVEPLLDLDMPQFIYKYPPEEKRQTPLLPTRAVKR
jgi:hypothetical protein